MDKDQQYQEILEKAKNDPNVIGFVLTGGRGKGMSTENSDYDFIVVVTDEAKEAATQEYEKYNSVEDIEGGVSTLNKLRNKGNWGAEDAGYRYGLARSKVEFDKTDEIQQIVDEKITLPEAEIKNSVSLWIDGFINQHYRAFKNTRDGNMRAAHLDAVESIPLLLNVLFGREGRIRPYNKFLEQELKNYPLQHLSWSPEEFLSALKKVMESGDINTMKDIYRKIRDTSVALGYDEVIKGWDGYVLE